MILKIFVGMLLFNLYLYSQQTVLFKAPPGNISLPSVIIDENSNPSSTGLGIIESKWVSSSQPVAESLLDTYSNSPDIGIRKIISDVLVRANVPAEIISKLNISFKSSGIEERGFDKNTTEFNQDFAAKYQQENLFLVTKLYRTNNAVIEITESGALEFNRDVKNALSEGLMFGNKTEKTQENKLLVEIHYLVYAFEFQPMNIEHIADRDIYIPMYYDVDIGINSITSMTVTEGGVNEFYCSVRTKFTEKPIGFKISETDPKFSFRAGGKESYTLKFVEAGGNKIKFSLSGFSVSFP